MIRPNQDDFPDLSDAGGFGARSAIEVSSEDDPVLEARGNMGGSEDMEEVVPCRTEGLECGGGCAVPSSAGFSAGPLSGKISGAMGRLIGNSVSNPAPWSDLRRFSLSRDSRSMRKLASILSWSDLGRRSKYRSLGIIFLQKSACTICMVLLAKCSNTQTVPLRALHMNRFGL